VYTETKPINIYDRDAVAAANAAATRSGTDEEVAEESPADRLPETLAEATAVIMAQFEEEQKQKAARAELEAANLEVSQQIEETTKKLETEKSLASETTITAIITTAEFADLKKQINDSLDEIANLLIGQQNMIDSIVERLRLFNTRSGQKI
jgi:DNA helicase IV